MYPVIESQYNLTILNMQSSDSHFPIQDMTFLLLGGHNGSEINNP